MHNILTVMLQNVIEDVETSSNKRVLENKIAPKALTLPTCDNFFQHKLAPNLCSGNLSFCLPPLLPVPRIVPKMLRIVVENFLRPDSRLFHDLPCQAITHRHTLSSPAERTLCSALHPTQPRRISTIQRLAHQSHTKLCGVSIRTRYGASRASKPYRPRLSSAASRAARGNRSQQCSAQQQ